MNRVSAHPNLCSRTGQPDIQKPLEGTRNEIFPYGVAGGDAKLFTGTGRKHRGVSYFIFTRGHYKLPQTRDQFTCCQLGLKSCVKTSVYSDHISNYPGDVLTSTYLLSVQVAAVSEFRNSKLVCLNKREEENRSTNYYLWGKLDALHLTCCVLHKF